MGRHMRVAIRKPLSPCRPVSYSLASCRHSTPCPRRRQWNMATKSTKTARESTQPNPAAMPLAVLCFLWLSNWKVGMTTDPLGGPPEPLPHGLLVLLALLAKSPNRKDEKSEKRNGLEMSSRGPTPSGPSPSRTRFWAYVSAIRDRPQSFLVPEFSGEARAAAD